MMMYDTPGSKIMRKTGFDFEIDHPNQKMEMNMISPWKTAKFEGILQYLIGNKYLLEWVSISNFSAISWQEQLNFQ
jgi:hypothetical protein